MTDSLAIVLAVETHQDSSIPPATHAESDTIALLAALETLGIAPAQQIVLTGSQATRTGIESRLRKLCKTPARPGLLLVFYLGHAFCVDDEVHLACYDTQSDDLADTSLSLARLFEGIAGIQPSRIALFLDPRDGLPDPGIPPEVLTSFVAVQPASVCFSSCIPGEKSQVSGSLKASLWMHLVTQALAGRAPRALDGTLLTAASLQTYLEEELPRLLRATFREAPVQTCTLEGSAAERFHLGNLAGVLDPAQPVVDPRLQPLRKAVLRTESHTKIKQLAGYRKFHRLPDRVGPAGRKFVGDVAAEDIKADVDDTYARIREHMAYKRRDVEGSADRDTGIVRTPDFEYSICIEQSPTDPGEVVWRREISAIRNPEVVLSAPFLRVFATVFDTLVFEFTRPFDLEGWVDRIEEQVPAGVKLRCASDCSTCDVSVGGFAGIIRLHRDRVEISGQSGPTSKGLIEGFLNFQDLFSKRAGFEPLPLLEEKQR